jgi:L-lactate dehydrogenase complex protein LldG
MRKEEPVGHASACPAEPGSAPNFGQAEAYPTLFDTFKTRAEAVSAEVHRMATSSEALDFIGDFLISEQGRSVWVPGSLLDGVDRQGLANRIPGLTFDVTREAAEASKVGISQMECAIADTGTLVTDAAPVERRLASALPLIHVAVVPTDAIQPDMASALARIHPSQSGYISMITGPSRTADIERVLTIGVHGPARLVIVFVDELGRNR